MDALSYLLGKKSGGGGGGTSNYNELSNKPQINSVELSGNKELDDLGIQNKITSTNKVDASFIDDSLSTNKFVTSAEKQTWNEKQDELIAGDNITIQNNVISASSGGGSIPENLKVYYNSGNQNSVDFIFDENETGIYFFGINTGSTPGQRNIKFYATNNSKVLMTSIEGIGYLFYITKYTGEETTKQIYAYLVSMKVASDSVTFEEKKIEIDVDSQKTITATVINNQNLSGSLFVTTNGYQQINAIKVFTMLPQCNLTPTLDNNLTNKKYVDDKPTTYDGYDATKTQVLKNVNGTFTWVDE